LVHSGICAVWTAKREQNQTEAFVVKLRLRERESIQEAVRRFRKLVEHSGIKKEMRRREFYEKPSDKRRRARRRAERRARMARMPLT
jgi:small subunit ribosomal protein S21